MADMADTVPEFGMTDLEESLKGPDGPTVAANIVERLDFLATELDAEALQGLPADDFAKAQSFARALASARSIMVAFTQR